MGQRIRSLKGHLVSLASGDEDQDGFLGRSEGDDDEDDEQEIGVDALKGPYTPGRRNRDLVIL